MEFFYGRPTTSPVDTFLQGLPPNIKFLVARYEHFTSLVGTIALASQLERQVKMAATESVPELVPASEPVLEPASEPVPKPVPASEPVPGPPAEKTRLSEHPVLPPGPAVSGLMGPDMPLQARDLPSVTA